MPNNWRLFAQKTKALEDAFTPRIARVIRQFREEFIRDMETNGKDAAVANLQMQIPHQSIVRILDRIYRTAGIMGARLTYTETSRLARAAQKAANFGRSARWIQAVLGFLNHFMLRFVAAITNTMREDILRVLNKAVEEGWSIDRTITELRSSGLIEKRARVIARTEIVRAANVGHRVGAQSLPYEVDKRWSAANDHRTRHSHREVHNHQTAELGLFRVPIYRGDAPTGAYDEMLHPGDPEASPQNTINCRCRVIYIPKRDAQGKLVMRNPNQATIIPMRSTVTAFTPEQIAAELKSRVFIGVKK